MARVRLPKTDREALQAILNGEGFVQRIVANEERRQADRPPGDPAGTPHPRGYTHIGPSFPVAASELPSLIEHIRMIGEALADGGSYDFEQVAWQQLEAVANHPTPYYWFGKHPSLMLDGELAFFTAAVRGLHEVLRKKANIMRCPAPGHIGGKRCGRLFVTGGEGRPRKYCSDACGVRDRRAKP